MKVVQPFRSGFEGLSREQLEQTLAAAQAEVASLNGRLHRLEQDLAEAELDEEVYEWIADVRRGVLTLEELYERTLA